MPPTRNEPWGRSGRDHRQGCAYDTFCGDTAVLQYYILYATHRQVVYKASTSILNLRSGGYGAISPLERLPEI